MKRRILTLSLAILAMSGLLLVLLKLVFHTKDRRFDSTILQAAQLYQVDPALVKAVVWRESRFDPAAEGRVGELGLMQIREAAASEWATAENIPLFHFTQLRDPTTNTMAGTWYLARLLKRYEKTDNPTTYALADYNAGRKNVLRWITGDAATNATTFVDQITFPGTRNYIQAVQKQRIRYQHHFRAIAVPSK